MIPVNLSAVKLYRTASDAVIEHEDRTYAAPGLDWDELLSSDDPEAKLLRLIPQLAPSAAQPLDHAGPLRPPIGSQEVWAAGVTYFRSRAARIEESKSSGGGDFYDRVYTAERPELFFKATPNRVAGHRGKVAIRRDAS